MTTTLSGTDLRGRSASEDASQSGDGAPSLLSRSIEWILIAMLAFSPAALGSVEPWSEMVIICLAVALSVCVLAHLVRERRVIRPGWSWSYLPIILFLVLLGLQLMPLPASLVRVLSPHTVSLKTDLLADIPGVEQPPRSVTLSFYSGATRHDAALVLAVAAVFLAVSTVYRTPRQIVRLLLAISAIGGIVGLLALAQQLSGADKIYWTIPTTSGTLATAGPFINYSHFAQFMNLSVGAALGLLLLNVQGVSRDYGGRMGHWLRVEWRYDGRARTTLVLCGMIVVSLVSIALCRSRNGVISALAAGAFTVVVTLLLARRSGTAKNESTGTTILALGILAFLVLLFFGYDIVHQRFAPQGKLLEGAESGRLQILKDLAGVWSKFPVAGTGLGTHRYVFPMFDTSGVPALAAHAENEYAQLAAETGSIGFGLILAFIVLVSIAYGRAVRGRRSIHAAALGLGYSLVAILVHSCSDFGQHIPANAFLTATATGLLVALGRLPDNQFGVETPAEAAVLKSQRSTKGSLGRWSTLVVLAVVFVSLVLSLPGVNAARRADAHWLEAERIDAAVQATGRQGSDDDFAALIAEAAAAAELKPDNVEYAYGLNLYRWQSINRPTDPPLEPTEVRGYAERIVDDLHACRALCPTFGPPYTLAGQLELFQLDRSEAGRRHIRTGYRFSPQDPIAAIVLAELEAVSGNMDESLRAARRAATFGASLREEAVAIYLNRVNRPDLALEVVGNDGNRLLRLADEFARRNVDPNLTAKARQEGKTQLKVKCDSGNGTASDFRELATICQKDGDFKNASTYWRRAIATQLTNVQWRLELAQCLIASGEREAAAREVKIVLRSQPTNQEAMKLLDATGEAGE